MSSRFSLLPTHTHTTHTLSLSPSLSLSHTHTCVSISTNYLRVHTLPKKDVELSYVTLTIEYPISTLNKRVFCFLTINFFLLVKGRTVDPRTVDPRTVDPT